MEYPHQEPPPRLYKYLSPESATLTLQNGTLRFSRSALFNDEFDLRLNLGIDFNRSEVIELTLEKIWEAAYGGYEIRPGNLFGELLRIQRQLMPRAPSKEVFIDFFRPAVVECIDDLGVHVEKLHHVLHNFFSTFKILCLSSTAVSAPMWGHYASNLTGAVLGFSPAAGTDSLFLTARPVQYLSEEPLIFDNQSLSEYLSGRASLEDQKLDEIIIYSKAQDWAYEREWRIAAGNGWKSTEAFEYVEFSSADLRIIIFGTRATDDFIEEVTKIVNRKYPFCLVQNLRRAKNGLIYEVI